MLLEKRQKENTHGKKWLIELICNILRLFRLHTFLFFKDLCKGSSAAATTSAVSQGSTTTAKSQSSGTTTTAPAGPFTTTPGGRPLTTTPGSPPLTTTPGSPPLTTTPGSPPLTTNPSSPPLTTNPITTPATTTTTTPATTAITSVSNNAIETSSASPTTQGIETSSAPTSTSTGNGITSSTEGTSSTANQTVTAATASSTGSSTSIQTVTDATTNPPITTQPANTFNVSDGEVLDLQCPRGVSYLTSFSIVYGSYDCPPQDVSGFFDAMAGLSTFRMIVKPFPKAMKGLCPNTTNWLAGRYDCDNGLPGTYVIITYGAPYTLSCPTGNITMDSQCYIAQDGTCLVDDNQGPPNCVGHPSCSGILNVTSSLQGGQPNNCAPDISLYFSTQFDCA